MNVISTGNLGSPVARAWRDAGWSFTCAYLVFKGQARRRRTGGSDPGPAIRSRLAGHAGHAKHEL